MRHAVNFYSQNGEDGVLAEVFRRLGITRGTFVEFGVGDGRQLSNTMLLAEAEWFGVWIEVNKESCEKAKKEAERFNGRVEVLNELVTLDGPTSFDKLIASTGLAKVHLAKRTPSRPPVPFDFLSIDIDSIDYQMWQSINNYRARVVLIEINSGIALGTEHIHGDGRQGTGFTSMVQLGIELGYWPVCHTGNLLFVDSTVVGKLKLPVVEMTDPRSIFNDMWAKWAQGK